MAAVIAVAVVNGNLLLVFVVLVLGIFASYFIKKNVQEITENERQWLPTRLPEWPYSPS
jgi:uncharacterized membrane protein